MRHSDCARSRGRRAAWSALVLCAAWVVAPDAQARTETLRWTHPAPERVSGFEIHVGSAPRDYDTVLDVGMVPTENGIFTTSVDVADEAVVYLAILAYGPDERSPLSNERVREPASSGGDPGGTGGDPGGTGGDPGGTGGDPEGPVPTEELLLFQDGALWHEDFEDRATGTVVPGFRDTRAGNSMAEDDLLYSVVESSGNRSLATFSTQTNIHSHYDVADARDWSDYELRGRMRLGNAQGGIGVTAYSQYGDQDVYYRLRRYDTGAFHLAMHPEIECSSAWTPVFPAGGTWYAFRLQVEPGGSQTVIRAKVWAEGSAEPAWQATCNDTRPDRPVGGTVGVWSMGPGSKLWDDLQVLRLSAPEEPPPGGGPPPLSPPAPPILLGP